LFLKTFQISIQREFLDKSGAILLQFSPVEEDAQVTLSFLAINFEK